MAHRVLAEDVNDQLGRNGEVSVNDLLKSSYRIPDSH